jgi:ATP-dependent helicase/DNAse subunit B
MALTLVLGPANSAKAGEVFGAYGSAAHRGGLLVVPNARDAEHYSRELARSGAVLGSVLTFGGLAQEIARRSGYAAPRLTVLQRERVVGRAVEKAKLESLARAAETSGFAAAAGELIAELERSMVSPQRFAQAMGRWAARDPGASANAPAREAYARDVAAIYLAYDRELERLGRVDAELFTWRALDALRAAPGRWGSDPVFFYGFDDLHPLQRDAVETLARVVGVEVMVSLTYEAGRAALQARAETVEELRPLAERVIELPAVDDYYDPAARDVLHHLERQLFQPGAGERRAEPGAFVGLLESAGERAEAELVAAQVLGLRAAGTPAEEIAVVYRSLPAALPGVLRVFAQYGIAVAVERRVALCHTALGRGLLGLARCALLDSGEASAEDLLDYLRTPGLLGRPELADTLELTVRQEGLRTAVEARARTSLRLGELDALQSARDPAAELGRQARRLLAAPHRGMAAVLSPEEELDARALRAWLRALSELQELGVRLTGRELIELLETIQVDASLPETDGAVVLSEPLAIRARRFAAVIIAGLQEGEFPRTPSPDPFLPDELRRELAASSGLRLAQRGDPLERERYLFYAALSRATERVRLSYRSSDEEGNLQLPSPFVDDVAELLAEGWFERRRRRLLGDVVWAADEAPTPRELDRARAAAAARSTPGVQSGWAPQLAPSTLTHVRHTEVVSAGALETYADCPVKWLVERELRPQRLEPDPEPMLRGSYMHDVLERVLHELGRAVTPESLPDAIRILDEVVAERPPDTAPGRAEQLRRAAAEAIAADLRRYLRHEAATGCGWEPFQLELRFGFTGDEEGDSIPALQLGEGPGRIAVRGAIDRVDREPGGRRAVVRDYKSGSSRIEHQAGRWSSERRLQVALYMIAVRELLDLEPVAGLYQPLGGRDLRARGVFVSGETVGGALVATDARDPEELDAELQDAAERAIALAARLRSGDLKPCPETCSRGGCAYPGICRVS